MAEEKRQGVPFTKKYKVLAKEGVSLTGAKGTFNWDFNSEVTDYQVGDEQAKELIKAKKLKLITE